MGTETERKFLVVNDGWKHGAEGPGIEYIQAYLSRDPERTVRVRVAGDKAWLTVKGKGTLTRAEFEYAIPVAEAHALLNLCLPGAVRKTRTRVQHGRHVWEVDEFHDRHEGLVLAEIELALPAEEFEKPGWLGAEVTEDRHYSNAVLSES